ncbi:hypothetical protein Q9L58_002889 [Maublancomyces gigas]|uniref:Uncharacterized protein n=1 Tax=Discina gigas TaxID=1032678 RepID=A0ABR3GQJ5_9PEZI
MVNKALLEDLEMATRRIDIQKEDKTCEIGGGSKGIITPRALGLQQLSSLSISSSLPAGGDYFSLSQEHHHRQGLYQTLAVYQPQDISLNDNVFTLKPLLPQMQSRFVRRPAPSDPSKQTPSPTTSVVRDVGVAAETSPQVIKRLYPVIRPVPADTVTLAPRNQQSICETMPPPPRPAAPNSANNTRQSHHVRGRHFSSLSNMLSTEPTAPGLSAVSQKPVEDITRYLGISVATDSNPARDHKPPYPSILPIPILCPIGIHTVQIPNTQTQDQPQDQTQDHNHPQTPDAKHPQQIDLSSIKQARLLGCPQYWVQRAGKQWKQDMEIPGAERARFEAERLEWMERVRSRRVIEAVHGRGEGESQAGG